MNLLIEMTIEKVVEYIIQQIIERYGHNIISADQIEKLVSAFAQEISTELQKKQ